MSYVGLQAGYKPALQDTDMITIRDMANHIQAEASGESLDQPVTAAGSIVTQDSRRVLPGGIFVAIKGARVDGNSFVNEATRRGANTVISEEPRPEGFDGNWLRVSDARAALARASALAHGFPSHKLALVGVTGTNGKTTTTHLVESIIDAAFPNGTARTAIMGTIAYRIGDEEVEAEHTTPESPEIQDFLRRAVVGGVTHAVMEVSSIALDLHRADELEFAVAAFTNLTQDHLDFHGTLDAYFAAKKKLFDGSIGLKPRKSVINIDDPRGAELVGVCDGGVITYGLDSAADIRPADTEALRRTGLDGLHFSAHTPAGKIVVDSVLVGRPHAYNILCAIGIGLALGFGRDVIEQGIRNCRGVAGRFERVGEPGEIPVFVDYAHTPDALSSVLHTIRSAQGGLKPEKPEKRGRVITVMGCGGDRDRTKRPIMGEEAARLSDLVIATSDNPRSEDPLLILNDIRVGMDRVGKNYELVVDRRDAIFRAILSAKPGDVVLIAGKGHETYQILPTGKIHFDDREVAREALAERKTLRSS